MSQRSPSRRRGPRRRPLAAPRGGGGGGPPRAHEIFAEAAIEAAGLSVPRIPDDLGAIPLPPPRLVPYEALSSWEPAVDSVGGGSVGGGSVGGGSVGGGSVGGGLGEAIGGGVELAGSARGSVRSPPLVIGGAVGAALAVALGAARAARAITRVAGRPAVRRCKVATQAQQPPRVKRRPPPPKVYLYHNTG